MGDGTEPIEDEELLYRRVQLVHVGPAEGGEPSPMAFHPGRHDRTGISVRRAKYVTPDQAAQNDRGKRYYIAVLRAGDLRRHGFQVVPRPVTGVAGHAELPNLTHENRHSDEAVEAKQLLARKLCLKILGPLP